MGLLKNKMTISSLLKLQLLYCVFGVGYNIVSYVLAATGSQPLSSTSPMVGAAFMTFYGLCLLTGYKGLYKTYRILMVFFLFAIGYNGIIKHFIVYSQQPGAYSSQLAWATAIGSNAFGFILNLLAVAGRFETDAESP
jgi:hypothetical protein